jgi:hypothetical protein
MGVLPARYDHRPIGQGDCFTWDADGNAVFRLRTGGQDIAGEWVIKGGEFVPAREG